MKDNLFYLQISAVIDEIVRHAERNTKNYSYVSIMSLKNK